MANTWKLYILRCGDGSLYTGITTDVEKRLEAHRSGKGAKYTRGRGPLELVYREECGDHSAALKRELEIKKLSREEKEKLIEKYGEFYSTHKNSDGEITRGTYMIRDNTPELIMGYDNSLWYEIYFEDGNAVRVHLREGYIGG
mgnify:CR=1 FL=1